MMRAASLFARLALGASFLSAVVDRFGGYGPPGAPHVAWGDFAHFVAYAALLNAYAPSAVVLVLAWVTTIAEVLLGVLLAFGLFTRPAAISAGGLLGLFALAMLIALGFKAPLDYSVFSAASAAFLVACVGPGDWSIDAVRSRAHR